MSIRKSALLRTVSAVLLGAMLLSFAACKGNEEPVTEESSSDTASVAEPTSSVPEADPTEVPADFAKKLADAKAINPEVIGYINVPGTNIQYPLLQSVTDNFKYESKDLNGKKSTVEGGKSGWLNGAIYLDAKAKLGAKAESSANSLIFGHNWSNVTEPFRIGDKAEKTDTMFAMLKSYTDETFAKTNPYIYIYTNEGTKTYKVFSVVYFNAFCKNYITPNPSDDAFKKLLDDSQARSLYKFDTKVDTSDKLISLVTCSRKYPNKLTQGDGFNTQRFAVMARLLRDGETDKDPVTVAKNTGKLDPKWVFNSYSL